jgi:aspartyl-tRNA(Asn)/glutamyl-tRNA(Gln) amidotransferase subunit A
MAELWTLGAEELAQGVASGAMSARDVLDAHHARAAAVDAAYAAFVRRNPELAAATAAAVDAGDRAQLPLAGVPIALKDNIALAGEPLTCSSRILEEYRSPFSATAVERLLAAGAVPIGQTNMDEFGMGSSCESSCYGPTRNPWDPTRVAGGSSGGSAAAVAAGAVPLALGSDTGGSIRQPAALCGVVGLKPTYGRVSRWGLVAFGSSLDQIGPLTRSVRDAALTLGIIAGHDPRDATSAPRPVDDYLGGIEDGIEGLRLGLIEEVEADLEGECARTWQQTVAGLEGLGATIERVSVPAIGASIAAYYVLANCEASTNLARFDGLRYGRRASATSLEEVYIRSRSEGFGPEVKRRILLGTFALRSGYYDAYYRQACAVAATLRRQLGEALSRVDLLVLPTSPTSAFRLGERVSDPLAMYLFDVFTTPASLTGLPALAVPAMVDAEGLPVSLQIMGRHFDERLMLRAGRAFERGAGFVGRPLATAATVPLNASAEGG